jgi:hypothetical protein
LSGCRALAETRRGLAKSWFNVLSTAAAGELVRSAKDAGAANDSWSARIKSL